MFELLVRCHTRDLLNGYSNAPTDQTIARVQEFIQALARRSSARHAASAHSLQVEGTSWDVGNGVLYLARDDARWVTGAVLPIDAGATAGAGRLPIPASDGKPS